MTKKLEHIEMALKREGYKMPVPPSDENEIKVVEEPSKPSKATKLSSHSVRIIDPKGFIRRDDLKNPYW